MWAVLLRTLLQLAQVGLPVLVGFLAGRYLRRRHLDQVEHDAWEDGYRAALEQFSILDPDDDLDRVADDPTLNEEHLMVRPLRKRERETHRAEHPGQDGLRVAVALDRENQPSEDMRERIIRMRAHEAQRWEATL